MLIRKSLLTFSLGLLSFILNYAQNSTAGIDFWLGVPKNTVGLSAPSVQLYLISPINTTCTVSLSNGTYSQNFNMVANTVLNVTIPVANSPMVINNQVIENQAIHITSANPVNVYSGNIRPFILGTTAVFPTPSTGNNYRIATYEPSGGTESLFLIVASENNTNVEITPSVNTLLGNPAGVPFVITMQQGQTYMVGAMGNLTGSTVKAVSGCRKFSVFAGAQCACVPSTVGACDNLYEQMPDINRWGKNFMTSPLATRIGGDTYVIMAHINGTVVNVSGVGTFNLNAGQIAEFITPAPAKWITSNNPILVAQYANGQNFDMVPTGADPFCIILPPIEQATDQAIFATYGFGTFGIDNHFLNLVTQTANISGGVLLDGVAIPALSYSPVAGNPAYSFTSIDIGVTNGSHSLSTTGNNTFIATTYGFGNFRGYGNLAGAKLLDLLVQPYAVFKGDTSLFSSFNDSLDCESTTLSVFIDSTTNLINISWDFGDGSPVQNGWAATYTYTTPGNYTVVMRYTVPGGCNVDSISFPLVVVSAPITFNILNDTVVCPGNQVTFNVPTANISGYTWWDGSTDTAKTVGSGIYTIQYSANGCSKSDTCTVSEYNLTNAGLRNDTAICFPDSLLLTTDVPNGVSYLWQDGSSNSFYWVTIPGIYFVDVNLANCHIFDTVQIEKKELNVDLLPDTARYCINEEVKVVALLDNATYLWSTGSTARFEIFKEEETVSLIAQQGTCIVMDTMQVRERLCYCNFFVPNSFTPNNDGKNEVFKPSICPELNDYTMKIYDRWGQQIFISNDALEGWNGKHGQKEVPSGIYTYVITYDSYASFEYEKTVKGHVNLIR